MKKKVLVVILVLLAMSLFAKGTCEAGKGEPTSAVLDLNVMNPVTDATDGSKKIDLKSKEGSREWQTIKNEGFEGAWPNDWDCYSAVSIDCFWSDNNDNSSVGSWSGWCADGGSASPSQQIYPNDMNSWMVYGPFSLADAIDADIEYDVWYETESNYDYFKVMASINGIDFFGTQWSGNSNGWQYQNFDLTDVYQLGDLSGQNQVWIAYVFTSDVSINYEGVYVDEINIDKNYDAPQYYGAPSIYNVTLENEIDVNNNGFYEEFCFEIDVDAVAAAAEATYRAEDCFISVYRDDNGAFLGEWGPFSFNDMAIYDNVVVGPFSDLVGYNTTNFSFTVYCDNNLGSDSQSILVNIEAGNANGNENMTTPTTCLIGNYPNPFNPQTFISYNLAEASEVSLKIYNVKGELVRNLLSAEQNAGTHTIMWDGRDSQNKQASSGVYFYLLKTLDYQASKRMIMLK